jgi:hypothetical protein
MDEGWTRWVLDQHGSDYISLTTQQIRDDRHVQKLRTIVFPDQPPRTILNGYARGTMPEEFIGGLGQEGVNALRGFVEKGGTLVFLNRSSEFAIEHFRLPIRNVVAGLPRTEFYVPGSILRMELDTSHPIAKNMPQHLIAWAEESPAFEVLEKPGSDSSLSSDVRVIGWYAKDKDPLLSGWLLGGEKIKGRAALVEVKIGQGRIVLFGFRPQYRAQSVATYPLFFNALK